MCERLGFQTRHRIRRVLLNIILGSGLLKRRTYLHDQCIVLYVWRFIDTIVFDSMRILFVEEVKP